MTELKNNTYSIEEVLPPRKARIQKEKHKNKTIMIAADIQEIVSKEEVNSRSALKEMKSRKKKNHLFVNSICASFFLLLFFIYTVGM